MILEAHIENTLEIARIHVYTWRAAYKGIMPESYLNNLSIEKRKKRWEELLLDSNRRTLITTDERGEIIGWSSFGPSRDSDGSEFAELYAIYILPDHWGKGYGRNLMLASEKMINIQGFSKITLWVLKENTRTRRFYENSGYLHDGKEKKLEIGGVSLDAIRYLKNIKN